MCELSIGLLFTRILKEENKEELQSEVTRAVFSRIKFGLVGNNWNSLKKLFYGQKLFEGRGRRIRSTRHDINSVWADGKFIANTHQLD